MLTIFRSTNDPNGIDIEQYAVEDGIQRTREDVDGENAGRVLQNIELVRDVLGTKIALNVSLRPLTQTVLQPILEIIEAPYLWVTYDDPRMGRRERVKCYSNNNPVTVSTIFPDGTILYGGISFKIIEC